MRPVRIVSLMILLASALTAERLEDRLPSWLKLGGEYRARLEGFGGGSFKADNDDLYLLNRLRINLRLQPASWLKFNFQGQDARVFAKTLKPYAPPFQDRVDLRMAFMEAGDAEKGKVSLRVGRQELAFGEQRLLGHVSWLNTARTFDAVRTTFRHKNYRLDAFAASVVNARDGEFNRRADGNNLHGIYGGIQKLLPGADIEPYFLWRLAPRITAETGAPGNLDLRTTGVRVAGKLPGSFDYGIEMAHQSGGLGADNIGAWAGHWRAGYTAAGLAKKPRFIAEYNYATGDRDPRDGRRGTFDVLYPTPHDKYGLANQIGWKNIHHLRVGPEIKLHPKWLLTGNYHSWWLASRKDALYSAIGSPLVRVASGTAGRHVGQELDAQVFYSCNKQTQIAAGFAHIFPGTFLKNATEGKSYNFPYLLLNYTF